MNRPDPIVFIVDDDQGLRDALAALLRASGLRAEPFASPAEFLKQPVPEALACLVLDVRLPGLNGMDLQHALSERARRLPIVFITGHGDVPTSVRAMKGGAVDFLTKPFRDEDLLAAVRRALALDGAARLERAGAAALKTKFELLTPREREVMALVVTGRLNKQVAASLGIAEITVKVHRRRIMEKMQAASLADLVRMADQVLPTARA